MKNVIKSKLFKDTATYTVINVIDKVIPFLIMPILSRILSKEEMGFYSLYQVTFHILIPILTLSVDYPIVVSYYRIGKEAFSRYFSSGFSLVLIIFGLIVFIASFFSSSLSTVFGLEEKWLNVTYIIILLNFVNQIRLNMWRITKNPVAFGKFSIPFTILKNVLGLIFIFYMDCGWEGIIIGHLIGQGVFCVISVFSIIKDEYLKSVFEKNYISDLMKTGIPITVHHLSTWFSTSLNRLVINSILGTAATGSFGVGSTFGTVITVLEDACNKAYAPYLYEKLSKFDDVQALKIVRLIRGYYVFFIVLGLSISLFGYFGVGLIFGNKYIDTRSFIIPVAMASVINGLYKVHVNIIFYTKKTYIVARNTIICALVNIVICYYMVSCYGLLGAAYASIIVQVVLYLLTVYFSNKQYSLPWQYVLSRNI